eukprot:gene4106-4499_t
MSLEKSDPNYPLDIIYDGYKNFWRTHTNLQILIIDHIKLDIVEVIAYDPAHHEEAPRLYIDGNILSTRIDIDARVEEERDRNINKRAHFDYEKLKQMILEDFKKEFILARLQMQAGPVHRTLPASPPKAIHKAVEGVSSADGNNDTTSNTTTAPAAGGNTTATTILWSIGLVPSFCDKVNPETHELDVIINPPEALRPAVIKRTDVAKIGQFEETLHQFHELLAVDKNKPSGAAGDNGTIVINSGRRPSSAHLTPLPASVTAHANTATASTSGSSGVGSPSSSSGSGVGGVDTVEIMSHVDSSRRNPAAVPHGSPPRDNNSSATVSSKSNGTDSNSNSHRSSDIVESRPKYSTPHVRRPSLGFPPPGTALEVTIAGVTNEEETSPNDPPSVTSTAPTQDTIHLFPLLRTHASTGAIDNDHHNDVSEEEGHMPSLKKAATSTSDAGLFHVKEKTEKDKEKNGKEKGAAGDGARRGSVAGKQGGNATGGGGKTEASGRRGSEDGATPKTIKGSGGGDGHAVKATKAGKEKDKKNISPSKGRVGGEKDKDQDSSDSPKTQAPSTTAVREGEISAPIATVAPTVEATAQGGASEGEENGDEEDSVARKLKDRASARSLLEEVLSEEDPEHTKNKYTYFQPGHSPTNEASLVSPMKQLHMLGRQVSQPGNLEQQDSMVVAATAAASAVEKGANTAGGGKRGSVGGGHQTSRESSVRSSIGGHVEKSARKASVTSAANTPMHKTQTEKEK